MKLATLVVLFALMLGANAFAQQAPAAPPAASAGASAPSRIAVLDFNRAVVECADGKKATELIKGEMSKHEASFTKTQGELEALQKQAQSQEKVLNDAAKADLARRIESKNTDLTRINEDAQKAMSDLQERHFGPVAQLVSKEVNTYATEQGLAIVFDASMQPSNILFASDVADITTEIIRRLDANAAKTPTAKPASTTAPGAPAGAKPTTPAPATPKPPNPTPAPK